MSLVGGSIGVDPIISGAFGRAVFRWRAADGSPPIGIQAPGTELRSADRDGDRSTVSAPNSGMPENLRISRSTVNQSGMERTFAPEDSDVTVLLRKDQTEGRASSELARPPGFEGSDGVFQAAIVAMGCTSSSDVEEAR